MKAGNVKIFTAFLLITLSSSLMNAQEKIAGYAPVNGLKMYYEIQGNGSIPLILIHGGGSTIETTFGMMMPLLANDYKVVAVELQAHGRTNDRGVPETFEQDADDVAGLLRYLKIDKADFIGFSNGGTTTLQLAIRHQAIVNKIIVIAGAYKRDGFISGFFDGMNGATIENMPKPLQEAFLKVTPDKAKLQLMFERDKARMISFTDIKDEMLESILAPALFIDADHDVITVEHTAQMSRLVPNGQLIILPGTHGSFMGTLESDSNNQSKLPSITVALIRAFLN